MQRTKEESCAIQNNLKATIAHRETSITELKAIVTNANDNIHRLEDELKEEKRLSEKHRDEMDKKILSLRIKEEERISQDTDIKLQLTKRVEFFKTLTSSYIQGLYEQCLAQEELILMEDQSFYSTQALSKMKCGNVPNLNLIAENLENKIESVHIDWESLLHDDDDRRIIFGNLNNRSQMNLSQIDNVMKRIHAQYLSEIKQIRTGHENDIKEVSSRHREGLFQLQNQIRLKESNFGSLERSFTAKVEKLSDALDEVENLKVTLTDKEEQIFQLSHQVVEAKENANVLHHEISEVRMMFS